MAFPQVSTVIDAFTRADAAVDAGAGASIWSGTNHSGSAGSLVVVSNQLASASGAASQMTTATLPDDKEMTFDVPTVSTGELYFIWGIQSGGSGSWEGYFVFYDVSVGWALYERSGGVSTIIDTVGLGAANLVDGDKVGVHHVAGTIRVRRYTSGAWNQTALMEVTAETTVTGTGPMAFIIPNGTWRVDNLIGDAAIAETGGGDPDPGEGPDESSDLFVDADDPAASDDWTRAEAANDDTKPFLTVQGAALVARSDPGWDGGDVIIVTAADNANPDDTVDTSVYPRLKHDQGDDAFFLPFGDNTGNPAIRVLGLGSIDDGTAPKIRQIIGRQFKGWEFENFQVGYDRGSGDDKLTIGLLQNTDLSFTKCKYTGGAYYVVSYDNISFHQCEFYSPWGGTSDFLDGVGFHIISLDTSDGTQRAGLAHFTECHFEQIEGEDALQCSLGTIELGAELRVEDCTFKDIVQVDSPSAPHTDCIQSLGGAKYTVRRCHFDNCDSPFIASDGENGEIRLELNLVEGHGNGLQGQGTHSWFIRHNTIRVAGHSISFGGRTVGLTQNIVCVNNNADSINLGLGDADATVIDAESVISNNLLTRQPGLETDFGTNLSGLPEMGTSTRLTDAGITGAFELANTPTTSPGIGDGIALTTDLGGTLAGDYLGRTFLTPPDVGAFQSSATVVGPAARPPYVTDQSPVGNGAALNVTPGASLYPKPGEEIDPSTVTTETAVVRDVQSAEIPAVVAISAIDGDGFQALTIDLKSSLSPLTEGELAAGVLYTVTLDGIADTEGSEIIPTSWEFRGLLVGPAIYAPGDEPGSVSFVMGPDPRFHVGQTIYLWLEGSADRPKFPTPLMSAVVAADSTTTFSGLDQHQGYLAGFVVSGPFISFRT